MNMDIPSRILLDTNIVNFMLDWGDAIHDGFEIPSSILYQDATDILALRHLWLTAQRASWQIALSPRTYSEISATTDPIRRAGLENWFGELWLHWREQFTLAELSDGDAESFALRLVPSEVLAALPDTADRELVAHAIAYGCDAMCTRDRKTILRHREKLKIVHIRILTPSEWWGSVSKYASLWT